MKFNCKNVCFVICTVVARAVVSRATVGCTVRRVSDWRAAFEMKGSDAKRIMTDLEDLAVFVHLLSAV